MKKTLIYLFVTISSALVLNNCGSMGATPLDPQNKGFLITSVKANYSCRAEGGMGCIGKSLGSKQGKACTYTVLGLISIGDKSLTNAMESGGMRTVSSIDYEEINVLKPANLFPILGVIYNWSFASAECLIVSGD